MPLPMVKVKQTFREQENFNDQQQESFVNYVMANQWLHPDNMNTRTSKSFVDFKQTLRPGHISYINIMDTSDWGITNAVEVVKWSEDKVKPIITISVIDDRKDAMKMFWRIRIIGNNSINTGLICMTLEI